MTEQREKNRPAEGGADTQYGVRSRKTFARALAWAHAEAKRGMGPGE